MLQRYVSKFLLYTLVEYSQYRIFSILIQSCGFAILIDNNKAEVPSFCDEVPFHQVSCSSAVIFIEKFDTYIFPLVQEANEAGALRLAKTKLERQLEDLTWRLQLEKKLRVLFQ